MMPTVVWTKKRKAGLVTLVSLLAGLVAFFVTNLNTITGKSTLPELLGTPTARPYQSLLSNEVIQVGTSASIPDSPLIVKFEKMYGGGNASITILGPEEELVYPFFGGVTSQQFSYAEHHYIIEVTSVSETSVMVTIKRQ